ncbi:hypothetical protein G6Z17_03970 [Clostridium perfringens]|uniref:hypothetical protein n=1 Tax=Clostridium perfringens TaxID=1502 RepID=UPI0013E3A52A|nr:hypothetical protein [Clostridium perfringens]NGT48192.1 hypothetical protein [Clostridium perfringens]
MKYYRYIITSIVIFAVAMGVMKSISKIDGALGNIFVTMLFSGIIIFTFVIICINILKFIRVRKNLQNEKIIRWSFTNEEWRRYINNETKERLKCLGNGLKYVYIMYIVYALIILEPIILDAIEGNIFIDTAKPVIIKLIAGVFLVTIVVLIYNFIKTMFFYFTNINSNGEVIMTDKAILINGELNEPDNFTRIFPKSTTVKRQYSLYYDDSTQFNMLKIESGETERTDYKGNNLNIIKVIRIPIKDIFVMSNIKKTFGIKLKNNNQKFRKY